jgi:hypothetical protein
LAPRLVETRQGCHGMPWLTSMAKKTWDEDPGH